MWFLLLTLLETGEYSSTSVHPTLEDCAASSLTEEDVCATVELHIIELPPTAPISVTVLDPIQPEMGPAE